jgi:hypothetical protein
VFGLPPKAALLVAFAFVFEVLLAWLIADSLRYGLITMRGGVVDRKTQPLRFAGCIALLAFAQLLGLAIIWLYPHLRTQAGVV